MAIESSDKPKEKCESKEASADVSVEANSSKLVDKYSASCTADQYLTNLQLIESGTSETLRDAENNPLLSGDALRQKATTLDEILHRGAWDRLWDNRDAQEVQDVMGSMSPDDLRRFQAAYEELQDRDSLREELTKLFDGADLRKLERVLFSDGKTTNYAGNLAVALETAREAGTAEAGSQFRALFTHMSPSDMEIAKEQWTKQGYDQIYGQFDAAIENSELSDVDKKLYTDFYKKDPKDRDVVAAAHIVMDNVTNNFGVTEPSESLRQFADVLAGDSAAIARRALREEPGFADKYDNAFSWGSGASTTERMVARDYLNHGRVSLETIINGDSTVLGKLFGDDKNIEFHLSHATDKERADFLAGQALAGKDPSTLTAEQKEQLRFFTSLNENFQSNGDETKVAIWTDVLTNGRRTVVSDIAQQSADGKLTNETLTAAIEGMSKDDWAALHARGADSLMLSQLKGAVSSFAADSPELQAQLTEKLQKMADAPSYDEAKQLKRSFAEVIEANSGANGDAASMARAVLSMTAADIQKYKTDADFRAKVDAAISPDPTSYLKYNEYNNTAMANRVLAANALARLTADKPTEIGPVEKLMQRYVSGEFTGEKSDVKTRMQAMNDIMHDPATLARMRALETMQEGQRPVIDSNLYSLIARLDPHLSEGFKGLIGPENQIPIGIQYNFGGGLVEGFSQYSVNDEYANSDEYMSAEEKQIRDYVQKQGGKTEFVDEARMYNVGIESGQGGFMHDTDYRDIVGKVAAMTDSQREQFFKDYESKYGTPFKDDFSARVASKEGLDEKYKRVFDQIFADGFKLTTATQIRMEVLDGTANYKQFSDTLRALTPAQRLALKDEYSRQFHSDLESDFLGMIPNNFADTITYSNLLRNGDVDPVQDFLSRVQNFDSSGLTPDGSYDGMLRALQLNSELLSRYEASREKLPQEVRMAIDEYFNQAVQNNRDSKDRVAETAKAAIDVAMVALVIATFAESGGSSAALLGVGLGASKTQLIKFAKGEGNITEEQVNALIIESGIDVAAFGITPVMLTRVTGAVNKIGNAGLLRGTRLASEEVELAVKAEAEALTTAKPVVAEAKVLPEAVEAAPIVRAVAEPTPVIRTAEQIATDAKTMREALDAGKLDRAALEKAAESDDAANAVLSAVREEERLAAVVAKAEEARLASIAKAEEEARLASVAKAEEEARLASVAKAEEEARLASVAKAEEEARLASVAKAEEEARLASIAKAEEEARLASVAKAEEEARLASVAKAEEEARLAAAAKVEREAQAAKLAAANEDIRLNAWLNAMARSAPVPYLAGKVADDLIANDAPVVEPAAAPNPVPNDDLIAMATVRRGEGPWQSAERILAADGKRHDIDEVRALTKAIQAVYAAEHDGNGDMSGLKVKYNFVTKDNYDDLIAACSNDAVKALLQGFAQGAAVS